MTLTQLLFALFVTHARPGASIYSTEAMPECGSDPANATCPLDRVCSQASLLCAPPRWSKARNAWVRAETREVAAKRYLEIARSIERVTKRMTRCLDETGGVDEDCRPVIWPGGQRALALALGTIAVWESGLREDVQHGYPPMGRGRDGEVCLVQIMPERVAAVADWPDPKPEDLLGSKPEQLDRCFTVGARLITRARQSARACRGVAWDYMTFRMYGTGGNCSVGTGAEDFAIKRQKTYRIFLAHDKLPLPDWAQPIWKAS